MTAHDPTIREKGEVVREPSLPLVCYQIANRIGLDNRSTEEMAAFLDLSRAAMTGDIPSRPSRLREYTVRVLHSVGLSNLSDEELRQFIAYCNGDDLVK